MAETTGAEVRNRHRSAPAETVVRSWEEEEAARHKRDSLLGLGDPWVPTHLLAADAELARQEMEALETEDPLSTYPDLWLRVFLVAENRCNVRIRKLLGLKQPWGETDEYPRDQIQLVIDAACEKKNIPQEEFWQLAQRDVQREYKRVAPKWEQRKGVIDQLLMLDSIPDDRSWERIQRQEAHLTKQSFGILHAFQWVKAARLGQCSSAPLTIDHNITADPNKESSTIEAMPVESEPPPVNPGQPALPQLGLVFRGPPNRDFSRKPRESPDGPPG